MIKINDTNLMDKFILENNLNKVFTIDMKPYMELFLFKKNEHICKDGEPIKYLFFLVQGKAKVYTSLSNGKALLLCFYDKFKILGDLEVFKHQSASTNSQVIEDTYCIGISLENVREYLLNDSKFLSFICISLGDKLYKCSKNSSINLLYPLENRLASYILATGEKVSYGEDSTIEFNVNLTEVSELLGASYRHLLRTLKILCSKELLTKQNNNYYVIDEEKLSILAADLYK